MFCKFPPRLQPPGLSGVVIAGFGANDVFPRLVLYEVDGVTEDVLKYRLVNVHEIDRRTTAQVVPFAQSEMVHTFMEGVDAEYQQTAENQFLDILNGFAEAVVDSLEHLSKGQRAKLLKQIKTAGRGQHDNYAKKLREWRDKRFVTPVLDAVASLHKSDLAAMAESLVSLTSFKRRVSMEAEETVGGPIDVAVISKGDGFVWMKRKHYFDASLNPEFMSKYLRRAR